jgi:LPS export ABC transporter protein LptC
MVRREIPMKVETGPSRGAGREAGTGAYMNHKEIERWYRRKNIMRACQVLAVVSVMVIGVSYVVSRVWNDNPDDYVSAPKYGEGMRMEHFSYSSVGARPWVLRAESAVANELVNKVSLTQPAVTYPGGRGGTIFLNSYSGELDKEKQQVTAQGAVAIRYKDFLFSTDEVHYLHDKLVAQTSSPVSVDAKDLHVTGTGLTLSIKDEEASVEDNVKTQIFNVRWVGANGKLPM